MNIYIMRHGKTLWNESKILQGGLDSPLTSESILEIEHLRKNLSNLPLDFEKVFTSPARRAVATATLLGFSKIHELEFFKELGMGTLEGRDYEFFAKTFPDQYFNYFNDCENYNPRDFYGESFESLEVRITNGFQFLHKNFAKTCSNDKNILIITHGVTIQGIMSFLKYGDLSHLNEFPPPKNLELFSFILNI